MPHARGPEAAKTAGQKMIGQHPATPFTGLDEMSSTYYALDPSRFGVKAWLHYQSLGDRDGFILDLLSGAARPPPEEPDWE